MDSLFDPTCVPVRVTINKLNFFPNRKVHGYFKQVFKTFQENFRNLLNM